mmetsp:Transcript_12904/g.17644  ORF Transcript_12904/g.17644 Transcript_12904/m.17644 type:complete len:218 (-) Transcript_12904:690-1343(-)
MADDSPMLLRHPGQEAGHVHEGEQRDVEGVTHADKPRRLGGGINVKAPCEDGGLVGNDSDTSTSDSSETNNNVLRPRTHQLKHLPVIHHLGENHFHIIGKLGVGGHQDIQSRAVSVRRVQAGPGGRGALGCRGGEVPKDIPDGRECCELGGPCPVDIARLGHVRKRPSQLFLRHLFPGDGLHNIGSSEEHVGGLLNHESEVREGGRVYSPSGTGAHY